jgi:hypothetical protein
MFGNGSLLTGITGFDGNASNISSGTLSNARLPSSISVSNVSGNGAGLSSLNLANVYGTLGVSSGGTGVTTSTGSGNVVLSTGPVFSGNLTGANGVSLGYSTGGYVSLFQGFNMNTAADPNYPYYGIGANATTFVTSVGGYGGIKFYTNSSTPAMSVLGQWVGVGTAAPMSNLHVIGTTTLAGATTLGGTTTLQQMTEVLTAKTGATGVVTHDFTTGTLFHHSSIAANFTCNLTNVPTTDSRSVVTALVLNQGVTPFMCNAFQIDGAAQTLKWQGGSAPSGTASKIDVLTFSLIRTGAAWYVLGQNTNFG